MDLIATKSFSYNTRRLLPGDPFQASDRDGRLLIGIKKAKQDEPRAQAPLPAPPETLLAKITPPVEDIASLRELYETVLGKRPFTGWNADQLKAKIAEATKSQEEGD